MTILAVSENQLQFLTKTTFYISVGQNSQQCKFIILGNPFNLFHAPGGRYITFRNSCPVLDTSVVCEKRNYKQLNFLSILLLSFEL